MKEYPTLGYFGMGVLALPILAILYFATNSVIVPAVLVVGFGVLQVVGLIWDKRKKKERKEDSICSFSRTLPARDHDTWIARAVYEALTRDRGFPIRPSDSLEKDLGFLPEDLEDLVFDIAERAGRNMNGREENPKFNQVITVVDLVEFLEHQPPLAQQVASRNPDKPVS